MALSTLRLSGLAARVPAAGWRLARYGMAGALVGVVYISATLLLSGPVGLPIQVSIPVGYAVSLVLHFSLQRFFVFASPSGFALTTTHQVRRYLAIAGVQYALTAAATATLPGPLDVNEQVVYVAAALVVTGVVFLVLQTRVFHVGDPVD